MPLYKYRAVDDGGAPVEGTMDEASAYRVTTMLRERGLQVNSVEEVGASRALPRKTGALSWKDLDLLNEQLAAIVRSNLPLAPSLQALAQDLHSSRLKTVLESVRAQLEKGDTLEAALSMHSDSFPPVYLAAIRAGEQTGNLSGVLALLSAYSRRMVEFQYTAKELLAYPLLVLVASTCVVGFLLAKVVPVYADIFGDFGAQLPWLTQFWVEISDSLQYRYPTYLFLLAVAVIAVKMLLWAARRNEEAGLFVDRVRYYIPFFRSVHRLTTTSRFSRTLGLLLASKVPIADSVELAAAASGSPRLYRAMQKSQVSISSGWSVNESFKHSGVFDPFFCWIVGVSEDRGDLGEALLGLAGTYEERVGGASTMAVKVLAPAIVLGVAVVVASIVIGMYLPIFSLGDVISGN